MAKKVTINNDNNNIIEENDKSISTSKKTDTVYFSEIKKYSVDQLYVFAKDKEISVTGNKSDILFNILKTAIENKWDFVYDGHLELINNNHGFLRNSLSNFAIHPYDIYLSPKIIKDFDLRYGDHIVCQVLKPKTEDQKYFAIGFIITVNDKPPRHARKYFEDLQAEYPDKQLVLSNSLNTNRSFEINCRIIDLLIPIGYGQRALILAPPKAGKTTVMHSIATSILANHKKVKLIILLIDERPEEVTEMYRIADKAEIIYSTFDEAYENHVRVADITIQKARRLVEYGEDVVILVDSITKLVRANNCLVPSSGRVLSGGIEASALHKPKNFFGSARNIRNGGSLSIIATGLVDTGSKMDDYIYEEFKGTGNCEIKLDRELAEKRIFPAINIKGSGTRKFELLIPKDALNKVLMLDRFIVSLSKEEAIQVIIDNINKTPSNVDLLNNLYNVNKL